MKIAFDLHGTIGQYPHIFKPVMDIMMQSGIEVCVMSGSPTEEIKSELKSLGYEFGKHYTIIYSIVDYLRTVLPHEIMEQDELGNWWTADKIWWASKGEMCLKFEVSALIDNEPKYQPFINSPTKFILWDRKKV